ncbi:hypothetical protein AAKU61_003950 [Undibacterium sp. GrIS 1.2]|uniref:hypothetical protein n=1 Tax=Undibacterium sp. GrIS 1.2 TaxID=3143933 RepID=UPI00339B3763
MRTLFLNEVCAVSGGQIATVTVEGTKLLKAVDLTIDWPGNIRGDACYANSPYSSTPTPSYDPKADAIETFKFATPAGAAVAFVIEAVKSIVKNQTP